ncbi:hypothetical protein TWF694_008111 [Orbilia ellipsospora]|uniref:Uncharacterized protein n=1 Tax=Orbilia ellipsospora TaxID=2528407 RepID=A0AAV9XG40_9PEZI
MSTGSETSASTNKPAKSSTPNILVAPGTTDTPSSSTNLGSPATTIPSGTQTMSGTTPSKFSAAAAQHGEVKLMLPGLVILGALLL